MIRALCLLALLFAGCHDHDHGPGGHAHPHPEGADPHGHPHPGEGDDHAEEEAHGHDHGGQSWTTWGQTTQVFAEAPAFVVGQPAALAVHLTRLADHHPLAKGTLTVTLSGGGHADERFTVDGAATPGIFRPEIQPRQAGKRLLTVALAGDEASESHDLGLVEVFATPAAAEAAPHPHDDDEGISLLLEQQWRMPFRVAPVLEKPMRPTVAAFAELTLPDEAEITLTAPRAGRIRAVADRRFPRVGDATSAQAPLLALDASPQDADPASLELAESQARIRVDAAQREVRRLEPLVRDGVVAQRRLDVARAELASARAQRRTARTRRASLGAARGAGAVPLPSPLDGVVADLHVSAGTWVEPGQPLARVVDRRRLWLDVRLPEAHVAALKQASGAWFRLKGYPEPFDVPASALVAVGAELDHETRALPIRFAVDNPGGALFPGQTTLAHLVVAPPAPALSVPVESVIDDGGIPVVYVQATGERFVRRPVTLGVQDGGRVAVLDGVKAGEWVAAQGAWAVKLAGSATTNIGHGHAH